MTDRDATGGVAGSLRIDRWLWCARFFKTRSLAARAVEAGHVRLNGQRSKAARAVRVGDVLAIAKGAVDFEICVTGIPARRGPAKEAAQCYEESRESELKRQQREAERRALAGLLSPPTKGRPDKRTRRLLRSRGQR
jgi:ribosome-associated heat shock protein Hsp15